MNLRTEAGIALAKLAGEETIIDDLSVRKVIDIMEEYGMKVAAYSYDAGNKDDDNKLPEHLTKLK
jgi:hypothetical protein